MHISDLPLWYDQAAVYGLGVCAEFGGSVFKPLVGGKMFLQMGFVGLTFSS